jgi:hypothetical protein
MAETRERRDDETYTEAGSASAGVAQRVDTSAVLARAETTDLLSQAELDARQARISERRRRGGPPLDETPADVAALTAAESDDVPPTDCADPPD